MVAYRPVDIRFDCVALGGNLENEQFVLSAMSVMCRPMTVLSMTVFFYG
jgi:hypothetical protein